MGYDSSKTQRGYEKNIDKRTTWALIPLKLNENTFVMCVCKGYKQPLILLNKEHISSIQYLSFRSSDFQQRCGVVLNRGPPGLGKTQTILGLLSAILHATPSRIQSR
ncbi:hypothetical protein Sjap_023966 [Stephania japonica]|uniref:DNA2/NAM7 helicase helicase domain-containing protein n=1 Tax=Stephania japonica TaxID=461633 RepID=A0AAP0EL81_9MAGN